MFCMGLPWKSAGCPSCFRFDLMNRDLHDTSARYSRRSLLAILGYRDTCPSLDSALIQHRDMPCKLFVDGERGSRQIRLPWLSWRQCTSLCTAPYMGSLTRSLLICLRKDVALVSRYVRL